MMTTSSDDPLLKPYERTRLDFDPALGLREMPSQALGASAPKHKIVASCEPADIADLFEEEVDGVGPDWVEGALFYVWVTYTGYSGSRDESLEQAARRMGGEFDFGTETNAGNIEIFIFKYKSQALNFVSWLKGTGSRTGRIKEIEIFIGDPANVNASGAPVPECDWWGGAWKFDPSDNTWYDHPSTGIMGSMVESNLHEMPMKGPWYRGTRRPDEQGHHKLRSYTGSPEIASIYAAQPGDVWSSKKENRKARYVPGSTVHRYDELPIDNPLDIAEGPVITMRSFLQKMHWGEDCEVCDGYGTTDDETCSACGGHGKIGIRHDEVCDLMNYLILRYNGHLPNMAEFLWRYVDDEGEEAEEQIWSLNPPMVYSGLNEWLEEWEMDVDGDEDPYALKLGYRLAVDAYALIDWPKFVDVARRIGYDGVVHHDVMDGAEASLDVLDMDPDDIEDLEDGEYYGGWWDDYGDDMQSSWVHDTVRPF